MNALFRSLNRAATTIGLAGLAISTAAAQPAPAPDTIFVNGRVFTARDDGSIAQAFAVTGNRFSAVGTNETVRALADANTRVVDLAGRFVSPGLTDAHFHSEGGGPNVDLANVSSIAELLATIGEAARTAPPGEIITTNRDCHEMQLRDQRLPLASELDTVAPNNPVVVLRGGHTYILNSAALRHWNITPETPVPAGGQVSRDAQGRLTGELLDNAKTLVTLPPPAPVGTQDVLRTQQVLNSYGITSVRVIGGYKTDAASAYHLFREVADAGNLTVRYNVFLRNRDTTMAPEQYIARLESAGLRQDQGDDWVRIGGIKIGVDGGFEGGHMFQPYAEPWGRDGSYYGLVTMAPAPFTEVIRRLNRDGWVVATHAAGDAALQQVLDAYQAANADRPLAGRRWAVEHAFLADEDQIRRVREMDLYLSVQNHLFVAGPAFRNYLGRERANRITPLRTYMDRGLNIALGTDADVIPINPFWELHHYMTRATRLDEVYGPDERVEDRAALLRLITAGYAQLTGESGIKGTIASGQLADFVVLSGDFLTIPVEEVRSLRALATYVDGREAYRAADY